MLSDRNASMKPFEHTISVYFRQTDMAGIAYFNETFNIFHDSYEAWVEKNFESKKFWFQNPDWAVPLKNVSCDYKAPLFPFENYSVRISLEETTNSTFRLKTEISNQKHVCAEITTTHVFMDKKTFRSTPIPEAVLRIFKSEN